jgi:hypothetical protein
MHSNDNHLRVNDPQQQYDRFYFSINEPKKDSHLELAWVVVWRGEDKIAPSVPGNLSIIETDGKQALSWAASADNVAVRGYEVLHQTEKEWKLITFCTGTRCPVDGLEVGSYAVRAVDVSDNRSDRTPPCSVTP